jgi:hypothetical protein
VAVEAEEYTWEGLIRSIAQRVEAERHEARSTQPRP